MGRRIDPDLTLPACPLCHRLLHEHALDAGADLRKPQTVLHALATSQIMLGSLLIEIGKAKYRDADLIRGLIAGLDEDCPEWRRLPEAKWPLPESK
jgi:hypothetical protein